MCVLSQEAGADGMKGARPSERTCHHACVLPQGRGRNALDTAYHLSRSTAGKSQQEDAPWIDSVNDQVRHPVGQGVRLAGPRARNDQERSRIGVIWPAVFGCASLFWIQIGEVRRVHRPTPHDSETRGILVSFATLMGRNCPNLFSMPYTSN